MSEIIEEPVHILFQFKQCNGLRGSGKSQHLVLVIKVEFNSTVLGESSKIEADVESDFTALDFSCQMNVPLDDPLIFDEIAQKPVVVTFIEILPKVSFSLSAHRDQFLPFYPNILNYIVAR